MTAVAVRRVYDPIGEGDGLRVLVDRLWPRGMSKVNCPWDVWCKVAAPSSELRQELHRGGCHERL